jgi:hypothetical protein
MYGIFCTAPSCFFLTGFHPVKNVGKGSHKLEQRDLRRWEKRWAWDDTFNNAFKDLVTELFSLSRWKPH